jgi:membrane protein YqaA with SNARE-associated domain
MKQNHWRQRILIYVQHLQSFIDRIWYPILLGFLSAIDLFVVFIPTDGLLISSTLLRPKLWIRFAVSTALGSTMGAFVLILITNHLGVPFLMQTFPGLTENTFWQWSLTFFKEHGLLVIFIIAATPVAQQPAVFFASIAGTPVKYFIGIYFVGRILKYLLMAYISSHAPKLISKMWGVQDEIHETTSLMTKDKST